jgi:hypothetical protein
MLKQNSTQNYTNNKRRTTHILYCLCRLLPVELLNLFFVMLQIFFVLRKKNEHVSTLHVIHHGVMPMSVWFGVKFTPGWYLHFAVM